MHHIRSVLGLLGAAAVLLLVATPPAAAVGPYQLLVSTSSSRTNAVSLADKTVSGSIYVFTSPNTSDIVRVRFYLDDPQMMGTPRKTESAAPYDFAGTNSDANRTANPFDTRTVADGAHTITAAVDLSSGATEVVNATFTVANTSTTPALAFSPASLAFSADEGAGAQSQTASLTATDGSSASFALTENASWLAVSPASGQTPATVTVTADPAGLARGTYTTSVTASATGYTAARLAVSLTVGGAADQVHLAWVGDPSTTLTVVWRTLDTSVPSAVEFRPRGEEAWQTASGALRASGTPGTLHEVVLRSLTPGTTYEYRVRSSQTAWTRIFGTRTAPAAGSDFDFVYVADTGLIGRTDGLATGTEQVRDEIGKLGPALLLGGGDYAYFDKDKRYGTLEKTIDAWFNQMEPIASRAPLMPTYGNHEVLLGEGFSNWAARFPTPSGFDGRRNYSFNVGDAHFVSIMAVYDDLGLTQATLDWIDQDLRAAKAAGQRWLIPFMHVSSFSDGTTHGQNKTLRAQLAPIFERHGVKLVISSHDQAYERSYPLVNVSSTSYTRTSTAKDCYTMSDGVTWVKVSPGGKLSNISGGFSAFKTNPPPSWTAARDNTSHSFAHVRVLAAGTLEFTAYGVKGDGSAPNVKDRFRYTTGSCTGPALSFSPSSLSFSAEEGSGSPSQTTRLTTSDGLAASYTVSESAPWMSVTPASGQTPATLDVAVDTAGLTPGTYRANITASAAGFAPATLPVTLTVKGSGAYALLVSTSSTRSSPVQLDGLTVADKIYVFTSPDTADILRVRFFLDDPQTKGTPRRTESNAPYDFAGGTVSTASPFDTRTIVNGSHTITAAVDLTSGATEVANATFVVANTS